MIKSISNNNILECKYNGDGLRVEKTVNGQTTRYLYEYDKVVLEVDDKGRQTARNLYGNNLITRKIDTETLYYMYNGHADVTTLIDNSGTIQASYYYDAFGTPIDAFTNENGKSNPIRYAGYQYDGETGLYYLNARYYDSKIARFLSEDTFTGYVDDPLSLNLYTYCVNNPLKYWDPTGHVMEGDLERFGANSDIYKTLVDLGNQWMATDDVSERERLHAIAESIRNNNITVLDNKDVVFTNKNAVWENVGVDVNLVVHTAQTQAAACRSQKDTDNLNQSNNIRILTEVLPHNNKIDLVSDELAFLYLIDPHGVRDYLSSFGTKEKRAQCKFKIRSV